MRNDRRFFTVTEFNEACKRKVVPSNRFMFREGDSRRFLDHLCLAGLLTRETSVFRPERERYFPTYDLYAALDVPPPLSPSPSTERRRNDARTQEEG